MTRGYRLHDGTGQGGYITVLEGIDGLYALRFDSGVNTTAGQSLQQVNHYSRSTDKQVNRQAGQSTQLGIIAGASRLLVGRLLGVDPDAFVSTVLLFLRRLRVIILKQNGEGL